MPPRRLPGDSDFGNAAEEAEFRTYAFTQSYTLAQSIHLQVALSSTLVSFHCQISMWVMIVPIAATGSLALFWRYLSKLDDRRRAYQMGTDFAFVMGFTPAVAGIVACFHQDYLKSLIESKAFGIYYWLLFFQFGTWLHSLYLTRARLYVIYTWLLVTNLMLPSFTAPSEEEELGCLLILLFASVTIGHALEMQCRDNFLFRKRAQAEQIGDSRLNHIIKNKTCAATFITQRIENTLVGNTDGPTLQMPAQNEEIVEHLRMVSTILHQNADWCHLRELFVQLQNDVYEVAQVPTNLDELIHRVTGRPSTKEGVAVYGVELDRAASCPAKVLIDPSILMLCLEEAFSNVAKYSDPSEPARVRVEIRTSETSETSEIRTSETSERGEKEHGRAAGRATATAGQDRACSSSSAAERSPGGAASALERRTGWLHVYVDSIDRLDRRGLP